MTFSKFRCRQSKNRGTTINKWKALKPNESKAQYPPFTIAPEYASRNRNIFHDEEYWKKQTDFEVLQLDALDHAHEWNDKTGEELGNQIVDTIVRQVNDLFNETKIRMQGLFDGWIRREKEDKERHQLNNERETVMDDELLTPWR